MARGRKKVPLRGSYRRDFKRRMKPHAMTLPGSSEPIEWGEDSTLNKNYKSLNLMTQLNKKMVGGEFALAQNLDKNADLNEIIEHHSDDEDDELREALGKKRRETKGAPLKQLTRMQKAHMKKLIDKYGDDFEAMFRDIKLNSMQHSVAKLKLLYKRYHASNSAAKLFRPRVY